MMTSLPVDPFTFHHPYIHQAAREFTFSTWYIIMLTGGLGSDNATKSSMNISSTPSTLPLQTVSGMDINTISQTTPIHHQPISKQKVGVGPNITESQLESTLLEALCSKLTIPSDSFKVNSVRTGLEGVLLNISLSKPTIINLHRRLLDVSSLKIGSTNVKTRVISGKLEHLYINLEQTEGGNTALLVVSFSLGLLGLIVTVVLMLYFGAKMLQNEEEDDKPFIHQEYQDDEFQVELQTPENRSTRTHTPEARHILQPTDNLGEQGRFLNPGVSYIDVGFTDLNDQQHPQQHAFQQQHTDISSEAGGLLGSGAVPSDISRNTGTWKWGKLFQILKNPFFARRENFIQIY